jgi:hypothetical protein
MGRLAVKFEGLSSSADVEGSAWRDVRRVKRCGADLHGNHLSGRRTATKPANHGIYGVIGTFEEGFNRTVPTVAYPARHAQRGGLLLATRAEPDSLNASVNDYLHTLIAHA